MPRGNMPRLPSRSGRQEGVRRERPRPAKAAVRTASKKVSLPGQGAAKSKAAAGYNPIAPERVRRIIAELDQMYPGVTCALHHRSAWELLVATILSAQSTDVRVNMVTPELFQKYATVKDFARLEPEQLEPDIRSTGFFRNKSKSVVGAARKIVSDFGGEVPQ